MIFESLYVKNEEFQEFDFFLCCASPYFNLIFEKIVENSIRKDGKSILKKCEKYFKLLQGKFVKIFSTEIFTFFVILSIEFFSYLFY